MSQRNIGVDILKFIAAILITNSHMEILYPNSAFATGGAIGNSLFFFCSGFTLLLKPLPRFDNFYKKRINRIYPTVFAWAILAALLFHSNNNIITIILYGGRWFISCIMIYYVFLYIIGKYLIEYIYWISSIILGVIISFYFIYDKPVNYSLYGDTGIFRYIYYFIFMLLGAIIGLSQDKIKHSFSNSLFKLVGCIILYYGLLYISGINTLYKDLQIFTLIPLLGICFYFYKFTNTQLLKNIYSSKLFGPLIKIIGGLCLEIYLVQFSLFTDKMNHIFPLNLIIMFLIIILAAYILRCLARVFSQIFRESDLDWKAVVRLY